MRRVKYVFVALLVMVTLSLSAALGQVSVTSDGKVLKWEEGSRDYFFMFKSLVTNTQDAATTDPKNPQADTCIDINVGSTYTLKDTDIPEDAHVEAAYLTWMGGVDPDKMNDPTDNDVILTFTNSANPAVTLSKTVTAIKQGKLGDPASFEFEMVSANASGEAVFVYRADVTDFFTEVHQLAREQGIDLDGAALLGDYNVKGMECSAADAYIQTSGVVGAWGLVFVYTSEKISPKKVYFYNGLQAYRFQFQDINVKGFQLPDEAVVRLSMMVGEGDPGLASSTNGFQPAPPEALELSGASNPDWVLLTNECNVPFHQDNLGSPFEYVEVFNSISSTYGWNSDAAFCIGGDPYNVDKTKIEYAVDVDTFILDAKQPPFDQHLKKDDDNFWLKVSANQDQVYTNMIVLSVDTKKPQFDIPANEDTPSGREKNYCSCSTVDDAVCPDRPFYYTIKIQNWGENIAHGVTVQDTLPSSVQYVPGTTEYSTEYSWATKKGSKWQAIKDGAGGAFPLEQPFMVAETLDYCKDQVCPETILVRFKVKPVPGLPKHAVLTNTAHISDESGGVYLSNSSVPLRLKFGACPAVPDCPEPAREDCLGVDVIECEKDEDCPENYVCEEHQCVEQGADTSDLVSDSELTYDRGIGSPEESNVTVISSPAKQMVFGRFSLFDTSSGKGSFLFEQVTVDVVKETAVSLSNIKLFYDSNANGIVDKDDVQISSTDTVSTNSILLAVEKAHRAFDANVLHNFIITGDAEYEGTAASNNKLIFSLNGSSSVKASDAGTLKVKDSGNIVLSRWRFEPKDGFVFTVGEHDPTVPNNVNTTLPVLQARVKSLKGDNTITSLTVKTTSKSVMFGDGIKMLSVVSDNNNNGIFDSGDEELGRCTPEDFSTLCRFQNLSVPVSEGKNSYLLFVAQLNLPKDKAAQFIVGTNQVTLKSRVSIVGLPVTSKLFKSHSEDSQGGTNTGGGSGGEDGCAAVMVY